MVVSPSASSIVTELVKNALLRCFCQTCRAATALDAKSPLVLKPLVRTRPPRRTGGPLFATEVRATEESKGGIKYELVLADPCIDSPVHKASPSTTPKSLSAEDIDKKLKEAEERRQTLEALKLNSINEKLSRLADVNQKKEESNQEFQEATRQSILKKIETSQEKREAYLRSIQDKLREHGSHIEEVRKSLDAQTQELLANMRKKMESAAELRETQIAALQERLRSHDTHIAEVRKQLEAQVEERRENLQKKLEAAQEKRSSIYKELQVKMQEKNKHALLVRRHSSQEEPDLERLAELLQKLEGAQSRRASYIDSIVVKITNHEKHAQEVRQNKAQVVEETVQSSG